MNSTYAGAAPQAQHMQGDTRPGTNCCARSRSTASANRWGNSGPAGQKRAGNHRELGMGRRRRNSHARAHLAKIPGPDTACMSAADVLTVEYGLREQSVQVERMALWDDKVVSSLPRYSRRTAKIRGQNSITARAVATAQGCVMQSALQDWRHRSCDCQVAAGASTV